MTYDQAVLVFLGMVGIMAFYVGAQAIVLRERTYGTYALYAACWFGYIFVKSAYTFTSPAVEQVVLPFNRIGFPMLAYVLYYRFAFSFLDMRHTLPTVYRVFRRMQVVILAYVLLEALDLFAADRLDRRTPPTNWCILWCAVPLPGYRFGVSAAPCAFGPTCFIIS